MRPALTTTCVRAVLIMVWSMKAVVTLNVPLPSTLMNHEIA